MFYYLNRYNLSTVISNGDYHTNIEPRFEKKIEVIKETPIYCKIICKNEYMPWKIMIMYDSDYK